MDLDYPTDGRAYQGLDAEFKQVFAEILQVLLRSPYRDFHLRRYYETGVGPDAVSGPELEASNHAFYFPMDCIQAAAVWLLLRFGAEPMLERLNRIKVKYGLVE